MKQPSAMEKEAFKVPQWLSGLGPRALSAARTWIRGGRMSGGPSMSNLWTPSKHGLPQLASRFGSSVRSNPLAWAAGAAGGAGLAGYGISRMGGGGAEAQQPKKDTWASGWRDRNNSAYGRNRGGASPYYTNERIRPIDYANVSSTKSPYSNASYRRTLNNLNATQPRIMDPSFRGVRDDSVHEYKLPSPEGPYVKRGSDLLHRKLRPRVKQALTPGPETGGSRSPTLKALLRFGPAALAAIPAFAGTRKLVNHFAKPIGDVSKRLPWWNMKAKRALRIANIAGLGAAGGTGYGVQALLDKHLKAAE